MKQGADPTRLQPGPRRAPGSFLELQKFPGNIRPPYYLQTLVLVQYCHTLVYCYLKAESELPRKPMDESAPGFSGSLLTFKCISSSSSVRFRQLRSLYTVLQTYGTRFPIGQP